jgi:predicted DNA-binding ribbon-helix-helix protein
MRADAGLHPDQAPRQVGKSRLDLATRPLLPQHDRATPIVPHDVERVLADIDADHGDCGIGFLGHGVLLVFGAPRQLVVAGHKTSVSLEEAFWNGMKEISEERSMTLSELVGEIDTKRQQGNLSSAIRLFVLDYFKTRAAGPAGERKAALVAVVGA